ncbi:MAG TPA: archaemetzincin family Zn-dependent metalloprotease [Thermoanaerobaculia bacterium]
MKSIRVLPAGEVERPLLDPVVAALAREYRTSSHVADLEIEPSFAHHPERNQYHSTAIIEHLSKLNGGSQILIAVTGFDLYIPILTFVFGEAQLGGTCAVVSYHRLSQEFYGLPADRSLLRERLVKEAIHEVGHTLGLTHCEDYECVMAASYGVELLDIKGPQLCSYCRELAGLW